ncbi:hypothetical protein QF019_005484 [Pseudomonas frederiksbergensis]
MVQTQVVIVGAGLSGLYAARLLAEAGVDFIVLEARERVGGRILSTDSFDLGPSWFWPDFQPRITSIIEQLGLRTFAQPVEGAMLVERFTLEPPQRLAGYESGNESMRIVGGTDALIEALATPLSASQLRLGQRVVSVQQVDGGIRLLSESTHGQTTALHCAHVILRGPRCRCCGIGSGSGRLVAVPVTGRQRGGEGACRVHGRRAGSGAMGCGALESGICQPLGIRFSVICTVKGIQTRRP